MEIEGRIKVINPEQQVTTSFKKRELVITTDEQYPQHILVEFSQDKCNLLDSFNLGENVKVSINIRGREWINPQGESKYFNSIQGWRIERSGRQNTNIQTGNGSAVDAYQQKHAGDQFLEMRGKEEEHDDLPF